MLLVNYNNLTVEIHFHSGFSMPTAVTLFAPTVNYYYIMNYYYTLGQGVCLFIYAYANLSNLLLSINYFPRPQPGIAGKPWGRDDSASSLSSHQCAPNNAPPPPLPIHCSGKHTVLANLKPPTNTTKNTSAITSMAAVVPIDVLM